MATETQAYIDPTCAKCGSNLSVERLGVEPSPPDRVLCPNHGFIGTRAQLDAEALDQLKEQIGDKFAEGLRDLGFDVQRDTIHDDKAS